jgi:hypothetical protein
MQERTTRPGRLALLMQYRNDLGAGHRVGDQGVAERLDGKRLSKGDDAITLVRNR